MTFDDLIVEQEPLPNRRNKCDGEKERHLAQRRLESKLPL
jgi:hypothetical protein